MIRSKYFLIIIFFLFITNNVFSQRDLPYPKDIPSLTALINSHKKGQDKLNQRAVVSTATATASNKILDLTEKYEEVEKKINEKLILGYNSIEFAFEVSNTIQEIARTPKLLKEYAELIIECNIQNPLYLKYYSASYKRIKNEMETCVKILGTSSILKGNRKEKYDILMFLKGTIQAINYHLETAIYMIKGIYYLNMNFADGLYELLSDDEYNAIAKSIADKIINEYSN